MNILIQINSESPVYFTDNGFAKRLNNKSWRVQLTDIDGKINKDARVMYEGNDVNHILSMISENWGDWVITEIMEEAQNNMITEMFGQPEPNQYVIRRVYVQD